MLYPRRCLASVSASRASPAVLRPMVRRKSPLWPPRATAAATPPPSISAQLSSTVWLCGAAEWASTQSRL